MKPLTLLAALGASVVMMGASVNAHADHREHRNEHAKSHRAHQRQHAHHTGYTNTTTRVVFREPSVCTMASQYRNDVYNLQVQRTQLARRYRIQLRHYGWWTARHTYYRMLRVDRQISLAQAKAHNATRQCEIAKRQQRQYYRYSSNGTRYGGYKRTSYTTRY